MMDKISSSSEPGQEEGLLSTLRSSENFRYSDFSGFPQSFASATDEATKKAPSLESENASLRLEWRSLESSHRISGSLDGVSLYGVEDFVQKFPQKKNLLSELPSKMQDDALSRLAINEAQRSLVMVVDEGTIVGKPIHLLHTCEASHHSDRLYIFVGKKAQLTLVEEYRSTDDKESSVLSYTQIHLEESSRVDHSVMQELNSQTQVALREYVEIGKKAEFQLTGLNVGASLCQWHIESASMGEDSYVDIDIGARGENKKRFDLWLRNFHKAPRSKCRALLRNVVDDEAFNVFNGMIEIPYGAPGVDAGHHCRSLLLSEKAQVQANPKLEIATDDVKCAHGASISSVDPEHLYYMQSRGINREDAEAMIVDAFLNPLLKRIPLECVRERFSKSLLRRGMTHENE